MLCFNWEGIKPCTRDALQISRTTSASSTAKSFQILQGKGSGPDDLLVFTAQSALKAVTSSIRNSLGVGKKRAGTGGGNGVKLSVRQPRN